jgi:glycosyltransferase involved in cell wall biosynthesis
MLTTFYPPWSFGGDGIAVQRLAQALAQRGHEVTVVHSREAHATLTPGGPPPQPRAEDDSGVRVVGIDAGAGPVSPLATYLTGRPLLARRALERALAEPFDVLHFHNPSLLGGPGLLRMGSGLRLYTLHEQWLVCPTHALWKYGRRVCERPTCWRCTLSYRRPPQPWRSTGLLERAVSGLDALIAPSDSTARLHGRFAPIVRIERIPNFIPDAGEDAAGPPAEEPYFLYVGRLEPIKGVERLIAAFRRAPGRRLLVAGGGSAERALRRAAAGLDNVHFLGWVDGERLDALYRGALALVVPTRGHESFSLVLLEAFARGVPGIVHRFGALDELAGQSGGALTYGSDAELDQAILRLAEDPALRAQLGARGRAAYLERWTPEAHLDRYFALIAELARMRGREPLAAAASAARRNAAQPALPAR